MQLADKKPVDERDVFYRQAAEKAYNEGDVAKAKQIYAKIKKKPEYDYFDERIEAAICRSRWLKAEICAPHAKCSPN